MNASKNKATFSDIARSKAFQLMKLNGFTEDSRNIKIVVNHSKNQEDRHPLFRRETTVDILLMSAGASARGVAVCHPKDNFNKKIGRGIALGRALEALDELLYKAGACWELTRQGKVESIIHRPDISAPVYSIPKLQGVI